MKWTTSQKVSVGVVAVVFATSMVLIRTSGDVVAETTVGPGVLSESLPDYSYLTADVSASAPGRALAIYQHGFNVEFMDFPQAVMVGADGSTARRIGAAETSDGSSLQGDNQPMALSPDGRLVAIGDYTSLSGEITMMDFDGTEPTKHPIPGAGSVTPLGWSHDNRHLVVASSEQPFNPYSSLNPQRFSGDAWLLDVETGTLTAMEQADVSAAAFSPTGSEVALERGTSVDIVGTDGSLVRSIDLPAKRRLNGPNAWSPDGDLLALIDDDRSQCSWPDGAGAEKTWDDCVESIEALTFLHADGSNDPTPDPIRAGVAGDGDVLGWLGPQEVLVMDNVVRGDDDTTSYFVNAVQPDGTEPRRLSAISGFGNFGVGSFQMASALVPDLTFAEGGASIDRGPWPLWAAIPTSLAAALVVLGAIGLAPRLNRWRRRTAAAEPQRP